MEETDGTSPDVVELGMDGCVVEWHERSMMPEPYVGEELPPNYEIKAMEQFTRVFFERYSNSGPTLYMNSLDEAITHSLFDSNASSPLVLYIHHDRSIATEIFCRHVLCAEKITNYLAGNFIVWAWDRTNDINYQRLLTMLRSCVGEYVAELVASSPVDLHPLLLCLVFQNGRIEVARTIEGNMSVDLTYNLLEQARNVFDGRNEEPDPINLQLTEVSNEGWNMSESLLIPIPKDSADFLTIADEFMPSREKIVSINRVENSMWLFQYLNNKETIDARLDSGESERIFTFTCPESIAQQILRKGFHDRLKSIHGRKYGYGFYFPSATAPNTTEKTHAALVCRVLVGQSCLGDWTMDTCPAGYDSTTNGSDTYVVYSNRHILPKYLIVFT
ncbi:unnamed protein product [Rotaria socialis]|uniref:UAS domain-containing protein n=1 Tax=Rotaria socialis TaxID=392032 RepID=A0A818A1N7_9BILA|nr:unnamed protein product [Rotaria socialis]